MKLDKKRRDELGRHVDALTVAHANVLASVKAAQRTIQAALAKANENIDRYNAGLEVARAFVAAVAEDLRESYDEKSDGWKEGDAGQAAEMFVSEWEDAGLDALERLTLPDVVEADVVGEARRWPDAVLETLPTEDQ